MNSDEILHITVDAANADGVLDFSRSILRSHKKKGVENLVEL